MTSYNDLTPALPSSPSLSSSPASTDHDPAALELWGGYECTVNRVGDRWFDQTPRSGHEHRLDDLALFAGLGMRSLRYPALWERMSPRSPDEIDFRWTDERLPEMARLGLNPIVTLCHHGSGPAYTSLVMDNFAAGLARHAAAVARRYPWVRDWTPVNEPLTTARFSALYGYWYPHTTDEGLFWRALLNEIDATRLAMREIRAVNPQARLVQTDDLGFCHATPPLQCEADHQNERRWMGWDLLCGKVVPGHALWERLCAFGLEERLRAIADDPCPPDVVGINHYLSSERLLDHRVERHPHRAIADRELGDCAGIPYVDVDAIRNHRPGVLGLPQLLRQAWERYRLPLAVTECHNGATREEQVRWFVEVWEGAQQLRREGMDLRAVTAWSLLGSYDWNRMVTRHAGHYEPGVFDVRSGRPRPTLLARVLRDLAQGRPAQAPGLEAPGWWRRESRFIDAPAGQAHVPVAGHSGGPAACDDGAPLLIVGDDGPLTHLAQRACEVRGLRHVLAGAGSALAQLRACRPWAVLDARDRDHVTRPLTTVPEPASGRLPALARQCAELGVPCALFVTAVGGAAPAPLPSGVLVARTGPVYLPWDRSARAVRLLDALDAGQAVAADAGHPWTAVYGPDLLDGVLDLLLDGMDGEAHFVPLESWTEADFARQLALTADRDAGQVTAHGEPLPPADAGAAGRPTSYLPPGETTLERFVRESRLARVAGEEAVQPREDEVRMEEAH
ncbi:family 1 glycosylhydrolase [Ramlibacter tataouinensis]|uniref:Candidate b-glycosidase, Glycoside Hydrolase Family 1 n=1 Tax=Ramlibacter tataouinensis (strain ATCC BAA-407 / DSM 14655 / LMG 21543 / TTB310) TaxID=365046 RepID=F5Y4Q8_RAMTT|nr:family 1 glycosylhydrolase [Ramlibacter tataouinensis]AEG91376.1 candidate b-glycosidase, Glycoside Hydrolase Family 1 [Ramlibacter tataouinensis TTB310]